MQLGLGYRPVVEVWGCFSLPKTLKLKALCVQARYRGAVPNHQQCRFGLAGSVSKVIPRYLCRRPD